MDVVVPFLSSAVGLIFALAVFDQFLARRQPYQLIWAVGLLIYAGATTCEFIVGAWGLKEAPYRLWYLLGAIFAAAYLGMGTVYLLAPRRRARIIFAILLVVSLLAVFRTFTAEVNLSLLDPGENLSGQAFPSGFEGPRIITPFFNVFGTVALVGGALYSAWVFWRRRIMPYRVVSNVLIAVGAMMPALGGTFARFGIPDALYILELLGVITIFVGFLRSREVFGIYRFPLIHGLRRVAE